uniref:GT23 domain-containing protein n=1 Tax=Meloidogyne enterolobii TaxID=390850 RepID=A0A6V7TIV8_MELEN|nr:unnamed protein product [Meloidogyne enterolobii]
MQLIYYISGSIFIFLTIYIHYFYFLTNQQFVFHSNILLTINEKNKCLNLQNKIESTTIELRHKLKNLFDLLGNSFSYNTKDNSKDSRSELVGKQFGYLLSEIDQIIESNVDTHKKVLDELAQHINKTLYKLQYPDDCNNRRLLVCYISLSCGFGCIVHHISYCLYIASAANRTLVFENDGTKWYYGFKWTDIFQQITSCNYEKHVRPFLHLPEYKNTHQQEKVVLLRGRWEVGNLPHRPEAVPLELKEILIKHHTNPPAWFMGQIIKFALRENQNILAKLIKVEATFKLGKESFTGIHVRRTDKIGEAPHQNLIEYMKWIDFWYNSEEIKIQNSKLNSTKQQNKTLNKRRLFIATDEPKTIIEELRKSWGSQYELLHNNINASYGKHFHDPQRQSEESLIAIFAEIRTLARSRFVVCTFSSNVCRLVYELMQAYQGYAGDNVYSLDYGYAEKWGDKEMISISDYKAKNKDEIDALEGDIIIFKKQKLNGFIGGLNTRTKKEGKFPLSLLKEKFKFLSFPVFSLNTE